MRRSGRCSAARDADAEQGAAQQHRARRVLAPETDRDPHQDHRNDEHREEPQEQRLLGGEGGQLPPWWNQLGDGCSEPSRWLHDGGSRQLRPAQRRRVDDHASKRGAGTDEGNVYPHGISPTRTATTTVFQRVAPQIPAVDEDQRQCKIRPARQHPAQHGGNRDRRGWAPRGSQRNTMLHRHSAMPPFQAIAVRPIGVST